MTQSDLRNPCKWCMRKTTALRKGSDGTTADGISRESYLMGSLNFLLTTNDDIADDSILFIFFFGRVGVFFCFDILQRWRFFFLGEGWCVLTFPKWLLWWKQWWKIPSWEAAFYPTNSEESWCLSGNYGELKGIDHPNLIPDLINTNLPPPEDKRLEPENTAPLEKENHRLQTIIFRF